jgi:hypothetical protein
MQETDKLVAEFMANGGRIERVPRRRRAMPEKTMAKITEKAVKKADRAAQRRVWR